jgi:hypothetical protein
MLDHDPVFRRFFEDQPQASREEYFDVWRCLDVAEQRPSRDLAALHADATVRAQRWFVSVQEREFMNSAIPPQWHSAARDHEMKTQLYDRALHRLLAFSEGLPIGIRIYGGLKSEESIEHKILQGWRDSAIFDLWDVVRFRIVTPNLDSALNVAARVWDHFWDDVVRCRNYYYRPRQRNLDVNGSGDPYRAVHFELSDRNGVFEVQVMTRNREAVSLLDHRFVLKRTLPFLNAEHESWLKAISLACNVIDVQGASGPPRWWADSASG